MNDENRNRRLALTVLISFFVFMIIAVAAVLSLLLIYLMLQLGLLESTDGSLLLADLFLTIPLTCTIIGFLITMLLGRVYLKPIHRLIDHLNRLARGDFKARIAFGKPISSFPEFKQIESSFNAAAEELEHTETLRDDFINNFSHEFKTPIVSIAGFAKLLRHGNLTQEQKTEYLAVIEEESLRLSSMATSVLNLAKVENQTILTGVVSFNLSEQLRSAVLLLAEKWTRKDLNLELDFCEHIICGNEELLKQTWVNLLDNAVKFSEPGGTVCVTIEEAGSDVVVSITNGGSIPEESLTRIFNKFYQVDESHASEGNGIGLAIVQKAVRLHRGEVTARSENGKTTFTVRLPRAQ